jgi:hypothetical protein
VDKNHYPKNNKNNDYHAVLLDYRQSSRVNCYHFQYKNQVMSSLRLGPASRLKSTQVLGLVLLLQLLLPAQLLELVLLLEVLLVQPLLLQLQLLVLLL